MLLGKCRNTAKRPIHKSAVWPVESFWWVLSWWTVQCWLVTCLLFFYSRCAGCPPCPGICKSGGTCPPRAPWSRRHCVWLNLCSFSKLFRFAPSAYQWRLRQWIKWQVEPTLCRFEFLGQRAKKKRAKVDPNRPFIEFNNSGKLSIIKNTTWPFFRRI